jgi:hypothetical protein
MATHTEYALRRPCISEVFDFPLAIAASKACGAKCLVSGQDGKILNLVATGAAAVGAVVANERAVAE